MNPPLYTAVFIVVNVCVVSLPLADSVRTMDVTSLRERLASYGQEHLLQFWDILTEGQKRTLYNDLKE